MAFTPITIDDVDQSVRQLEKNDPVQDKANTVAILVQLYNVIGEMQDNMKNHDFMKTSATVAMPNIDILKALVTP